MTQQQQQTELVVIGAGPGGYAAAFLGADLGMKVSLIDPEVNPGGVCLYRGCIPAKALLHACKSKKEAQAASQWGFDFGEPDFDLTRLRNWKNSVVEKLTKGLGVLTKQRKINYIQGIARFLDPHTLSFYTQDGTEGHLRFDHAIIAVGTEPVPLGDLSFNSSRVLDSKKALDIARIPESLLVIGGGYIGLELGTVYAILGSKVTIVEKMPELMMRADRDLMKVFTKATSGLFEAIYTATAANLREQSDGIKAHLQGDAGDKELLFDQVLVTIGRKPRSKGLGLENIAVTTDSKGFIEVDSQRRTNVPSVYAIGDITGDPLLAHKASHEGRVAVEAIAGKASAFDPRAIPAVEYTDPEVAWCGLTETEARQQGIEIETGTFPWAASGRAATRGRTDGLTKLIIDPHTNRILGVGIVGVDAGELISEGALAIELAARASDLALTIHPHPTLSETLMEAAEAYDGTSTHVYKPKKRSL